PFPGTGASPACRWAAEVVIAFVPVRAGRHDDDWCALAYQADCVCQLFQGVSVAQNCVRHGVRVAAELGDHLMLLLLLALSPAHGVVLCQPIACSHADSFTVLAFFGTSGSRLCQ